VSNAAFLGSGAAVAPKPGIPTLSGGSRAVLGDPAAGTAFSTQTVEVRQHLVGMIRRRHLVVSRFDAAVGADQHRNAPRPLRLGFRRAVCDRGRLVLVAAEVVGKSELFAERLVVLGRIETDAENDCILIGELLDSITEPIAFGGSPRGIGFRIPPEQNVLSRVLLQRHGLAVLVRQRERRRRFPDFDQCHIRLAKLLGKKINGRNTIMPAIHGTSKPV
jgi:hypothetical protein